MTNDPIVAEVHAIRAKLAKECDYDIVKMCERHRRIFAEWKGKKITAPFHPEWRAPEAKAAIVAEDSSGYRTE